MMFNGINYKYLGKSQLISGGQFFKFYESENKNLILIPIYK